MKITIPDGVPSIAGELELLGRLLTAKHWERAALIYAATHSPGTGHRREKATGGLLTARQFAELGIYGLRSHTTVAAYRDAWQAACDEGYAEPALLGVEVELPDPDEHPFPPPVPVPDTFGPETTEQRFAGSLGIAEEVMAADSGEVVHRLTNGEEPAPPEEPVRTVTSIDWVYETTRICERIGAAQEAYRRLQERFADDREQRDRIARRVEPDIAELHRGVMADLAVTAGELFRQP